MSAASFSLRHAKRPGSFSDGSFAGCPDWRAQEKRVQNNGGGLVLPCSGRTPAAFETESRGVVTSALRRELLAATIPGAPAVGGCPPLLATDQLCAARHWEGGCAVTAAMVAAVWAGSAAAQTFASWLNGNSGRCAQPCGRVVGTVPAWKRRGCRILGHSDDCG